MSDQPINSQDLPDNVTELHPENSNQTPASQFKPKELPKKGEPYHDWEPQTLGAYQQTIVALLHENADLKRVATVNANITCTSIAVTRLLLDKGIITQQEVAALVPAAQQQGLALIGLEIRTGLTENPPEPTKPEKSAEDYYEEQGATVWDGKARLHTE